MVAVEEDDGLVTVTYGDVYRDNERQYSRYNFETADTEMSYRHFRGVRGRGRALPRGGLPVPAYDYVLKCSHAFNFLDARGVISVTDRTRTSGGVCDLARKVARIYLEQQEAAARA